MGTVESLLLGPPNSSADDAEPKNGALVESRALFIPTSIHF